MGRFFTESETPIAWLSRSGEQTLQLAKSESKRLNYADINTGSLLLGVIHWDHTLVHPNSRLLTLARNAMVFKNGRGDSIPPRRLWLTPAAKRVMNEACYYAAASHAGLVGPADMVAAIARINEGMAASILKSLEINPQDVIARADRTPLVTELAGQIFYKLARNFGPYQRYPTVGTAITVGI